ncbi:hypothetical protein Tco_0568478 [Tanacetum coccineum]
MGRGTWYYSLGVFLEIVDVFVRSEFEISSWRGARVDVRTYLLGGAIDSSEANGIIRDPKLELESSRFTFDLVPLSYESVDVVVGENWLLRHKAEMVCHEKVVKMPCVPKELVGFTPRRRIGFRMELVQGATPICEGSCRLTSLERQEVWNDCRSCKVRVGSNGNLLWEASVLLGRKKGGVHGDEVAKTVFRMRNGHVEVYSYAFWVNQCTNGFHGVNEPGGVRVAREEDRGVTKGREDVHEVFQQRGSGAKRKLSGCGRNQMGNEPILALPEGADYFVVYYDARSKDLKACLEKGRRLENVLPVVAIDGSEANGIIRDPKLELESSRFTFDLVPLSYESVDVVVGENWLLRHKAVFLKGKMVCHEKVVKMPWSCKVRVGSNGNLLWEVSVLLGRKKGGVHGDDVAKTVFRMRNGHVEVYGYAFWVNQCTSGFHGVNEPGGVRVAREDDRGVTEGREDVREVFQQRGSGAKRKLSRCGRNQMGNEPILALPEGADNFAYIMMREARI